MDKHGEARQYQSAYLRRTWREDGKVRNETVANLSALPDHVIAGIEAGLKGQQLVPADGRATIVRSLPHGHVAAVWAQAAALGLPALLGPASKARDLVLALVIARVCRPGSKPATTRWWQDTTLAVDLGVAAAGTDEVYAAMDWLAGRQEGIEKKLATKHLGPDVNPRRLALFDLSSSWVTGTHCPLAARGLLARREERLAADRVRAAHRPGRAARRDPCRAREHGRPDRVRADRGSDENRVRSEGDGHGRRPRPEPPAPAPAGPTSSPGSRV